MFIKNYSFNKTKATYHGFRNRLRLFFERDVKARQIASNVGSTFRNSKWTDYTLNNVSRLTLSVDLNPLFNFFTILLLGIYLMCNTNFFTNYIDSDQVFFFMWFPLCLLDLLELPTQTPFLCQGLFALLPFLYSRVLISALTTNEAPLKSWVQAHSVEKSLPHDKGDFSQPQPLFNQSQYSKEYFDSLPSTFSGGNVLTIRSIFLDKLLFDLLNFSKSDSPNKFVSPNTLWSFEGFYWDTTPKTYLSTTDRGLQTTTAICENLTTSSDKPFYSTILNFQKLNFLFSHRPLFDLTWSLEDKARLIGNLRWSYRYNLLHRRSIHNSHKLTDTKKLLNAGFFGLNLTDSNVWFSDEYARTLTNGKRKRHVNPLQLIKSNWTGLYHSSLGGNNLFNTGYLMNPSFHQSQDVYQRLSFYEASFHFFLHRTSLYSSLGSNTPSLVFKKPITTINHMQSNLSQLRNLHLTTTTTFYRNVFKSGQLNLTTSPKPVLSNLTPTGLRTKDTLVLKFDTNLLNLRSLEVLLSSTKSNQLLNQKFYFFDYLCLRQGRFITKPLTWGVNTKPARILKHKFN